MLINTLDILTELALWFLLFGITFSNSITEIFAISIIVFFIIRRTLLKNFKLPKTPVNPVLYVLCAIVFITFLRSAYFSESVRGLLRIIKFIFLFFALTEFFRNDEKRIRRVFWVIMAVACFAFLNAVFQSIYSFDLLRHRDINNLDYLRRISGSFAHPNDFAGYIIFILPLTLCLFCSLLKKGQKVFLAINFLLGAYCLLRTSSRSAWLGFLIGIVMYFFFYRKRKYLIIPLILMLFVIVSAHGVDRIRSLFVFEQNSMWERVQLWQGTWNMIKVHPVLGFGINTFSRYFPQYKPPTYWGIMYAHNSYLQMWSEIGILGLSAYLVLMFTIIISAFRGIREKMKKNLYGFVLLGAISGYIAFLIHSGLDTDLFALKLTTLFWIMNAYILSINSSLEKKV